MRATKSGLPYLVDFNFLPLRSAACLYLVRRFARCLTGAVLYAHRAGEGLLSLVSLLIQPLKRVRASHPFHNKTYEMDGAWKSIAKAKMLY
jgi:hypothetical protein